MENSTSIDLYKFEIPEWEYLVEEAKSVFNLTDTEAVSLLWKQDSTHYCLNTICRRLRGSGENRNFAFMRLYSRNKRIPEILLSFTV